MPHLPSRTLSRVVALLLVLSPTTAALADASLPGPTTAVATPAAVTPTTAPTVKDASAPAEEPAPVEQSVTIAMSALRLLVPMLQFKAEAHVGQRLVLGGYAGWGSPKRDGLDSKSQIEGGAHLGLYIFGNSHRGVGMMVQGRALQATGKMGELDSTSYGYSGTLSASVRYTFDSDAVLDFQVGRDYLYSWVALGEGEAGGGQGHGSTLVNLWFGWAF